MAYWERLKGIKSPRFCKKKSSGSTGSAEASAESPEVATSAVPTSPPTSLAAMEHPSPTPVVVEAPAIMASHASVPPLDGLEFDSGSRQPDWLDGQDSQFDPVSSHSRQFESQLDSSRVNRTLFPSLPLVSDASFPESNLRRQNLGFFADPELIQDLDTFCAPEPLPGLAAPLFCHQPLVGAPSFGVPMAPLDSEIEQFADTLVDSPPRALAEQEVIEIPDSLDQLPPVSEVCDAPASNGEWLREALAQPLPQPFVDPGFATFSSDPEASASVFCDSLFTLSI